MEKYGYVAGMEINITGRVNRVFNSMCRSNVEKKTIKFKREIETEIERVIKKILHSKSSVAVKFLEPKVMRLMK
jgi:hypothetical protein